MAQLNLKTAINLGIMLSESRYAAKSLFKDEYKEELMPYVDIVKKTMNANNCDEINALILVSRTHAYQDSEIAQTMFIAAVLEIIESSES